MWVDVRRPAASGRVMAFNFLFRRDMNNFNIYFDKKRNFKVYAFMKRKSIIMNLQLIIIIAAALFFTGCSPVEKVKWSRVDLLGNEIPVRRIVSSLSGSGGEVKWTHQQQIVYNGCDIVSARVNRKGTLFLLSFSRDRESGECRLAGYSINGKPESPLFIYRYLTVNRYRFLPPFLDLFL